MIELRANEPRPTPLLPGDPWTRLGASYRRSITGGEEVVLLALELPERGRPGNADRRERRLRDLEAMLLTLPGAEGVAVARRGTRLIALLPGRSAKQGEELANALVGAARRLAASGPDGRVVPLVGLSRTPAEGALHLETLVRVAEAGARVAGFRGGGSIVHTMLYDVIEERVRSEGTDDRDERVARAERDVPSQVTPEVSPASREVPRAEPSPEEQRVLEDEVLGVVARRIAHELAEAGPPGEGFAAGALGALGREVTERVLAALRKELAGRLDAKGARPDESDASAEIELLQRRIRKLVRILEQTEDRLGEMERRCAEDPGIESVYRTVQGLSGTEPGFEHKQALMRQVLEANLALQHTLAARKRLPARRPLPGPARGRSPRSQRGVVGRGEQLGTGAALTRG